MVSKYFFLFALTEATDSTYFNKIQVIATTLAAKCLNGDNELNCEEKYRRNLHDK